MKTVRLSSRGELLLPKAIRDRHKWRAGTDLVIIERGAEVVIKPAKIFPATELEPPDTPSVYHGKPLSLDEMEQALTERKGEIPPSH